MGWALFANETFAGFRLAQPYHYNMVKGLIFTISIRFAFETRKHHFHQPESLGNRRIETIILVQTESESFSCSKLFNSIYHKQKAENQTKYPVLQQHFIGWFSEQAVFNMEQATFMDFR
jgi:lycopene beta-cyclase